MLYPEMQVEVIPLQCHGRHTKFWMDKGRKEGLLKAQEILEREGMDLITPTFDREPSNLGFLWTKT